jgi:hypothetical protein
VVHFELDAPSAGSAFGGVFAPYRERATYDLLEIKGKGLCLRRFTVRDTQCIEHSVAARGERRAADDHADCGDEVAGGEEYLPE